MLEENVVKAAGTSNCTTEDRATPHLRRRRFNPPALNLYRHFLTERRYWNPKHHDLDSRQSVREKQEMSRSGDHSAGGKSTESAITSCWFDWIGYAFSRHLRRPLAVKPESDFERTMGLIASCRSFRRDGELVHTAAGSSISYFIVVHLAISLFESVCLRSLVASLDRGRGVVHYPMHLKNESVDCAPKSPPCWRFVAFMLHYCAMELICTSKRRDGPRSRVAIDLRDKVAHAEFLLVAAG